MTATATTGISPVEAGTFEYPEGSREAKGTNSENGNYFLKAFRAFTINLHENSLIIP